MRTVGARWRVGVDIGGTFTDIVAQRDDGTVVIKKLASTPPDYSQGILAGLREIRRERAIAASTLDAVVHGTTVATNAILEGAGARTALITTAGFRDVLELRRIRIPQLYNLFYTKPKPLVPRRRRFEVDERLGPHGEIRRPLSDRSLDAVIDRLRASGAEAVAVCLLHSYVNPAHERRVGETVRQALPHAYVSCSIDILPEIREYERTSTTVINAYVGPIVDRYLTALVRGLREDGVQAPLWIMQSDGGVTGVKAAVVRPAHIVESGPAAGVVAAACLARRTRQPDIITFDMGGTTTKASMIEGGRLLRTSEYEVGGGINLSSLLVKGGGYALKLPLIDVSEIGAGGGSIVWIDEDGGLRVGPRSAGAHPGPACYDTGGLEATVTDVHVVLGYINPASLAGGRVRLDAALAARIVGEQVAAPLERPLLEAAYGSFRIAIATMMRAVKAVSTYRGRDPRDFALLAFGGSGPICAAELARALSMRRVIVPPAAGLFSALGLLQADVEQQFVRTHLRRVSELSGCELGEAFARLERTALAHFRDADPGAGRPSLRRFADLRYAGQGYELTVPVANDLDDDGVADLIEAFGREHERTYGHRAVDEPVELVNVRVFVTATGGRAPTVERGAAGGPGTTAPRGRSATNLDQRTRTAYFGPEVGLCDAPVVERRALAGQPRTGPLLVDEYDTTCVVPPGWGATLDEWDDIILTAPS